ncbi:MAG TPA: tellurite resistance TerB family protein [Alphaproteobacteria bacterium]|nr:tellurite resistance TerB family protein [Alphaproteobacteria bacterium]
MSDDILSPQDAIIYIMVLFSAVDRQMTDRELQRIGQIVHNWPIFESYNDENIIPAAQDCARLLQEENGLDRVFDHIVASLPAHLAETAYAAACDVAAADSELRNVEIRLLQLLRQRLDIDKLTAAALERAAHARYARE